MAGTEAMERTGGSMYFDFMTGIFEPGTVPSWFAVGEVLSSKAEGFESGELVFGQLPWRTRSVLAAEQFSATGGMLLPRGITPEFYMSTMGLTAQTGYLGAKHICLPEKGKIAYVSGAAGATGLVAAQTLKNLGCRVVGSAGSDDKVKLLEGAGIEAFNYKKEAPLEGLQRLCPNGFDVAFDNVGGDTLEAMLEMINDGGRIALCGNIADYDKPPECKYGVKNLFHLTAKSITLRGFLVFEFTPEQMADCTATLEQWAQEGKLKVECTIVDGFDRLIHDGVNGLFKGTNTGKLMVKAD